MCVYSTPIIDFPIGKKEVANVVYAFYDPELRTSVYRADPGGSADYGVALRQIACWDCEFESRWGYGRLPPVTVLCFQVVCTSG
jgi:hypothetical protein